MCGLLDTISSFKFYKYFIVKKELLVLQFDGRKSVAKV